MSDLTDQVRAHINEVGSNVSVVGTWLAALCDEVEALTRAVKGNAATIARLRVEGDTLRAEMERLTRELDARPCCGGPCQRDRESLAESWQQELARAEAAEAKNERLRAALADAECSGD